MHEETKDLFIGGRPVGWETWSRKRRRKWIRRARKRNDFQNQVVKFMMKEAIKKTPFAALLMGPMSAPFWP